MFHNCGKNRFTYNEYLPGINLKDYISCYWYFKFEGSDNQFFNILPDGCFDLLITVRNNRIEDIKLTGIWDQHVAAEYNYDFEIFAIRFRPSSIGQIVKFSVRECFNGAISFDLKDFKLNRETIENILGSDPHLIFQYFNDIFANYFTKRSTSNRSKIIFDIIDYNSGSISVKQVAESLKLSTRQIQRIVNNSIGISPKRYSKIVRFRESIKTSDLTNYYDQSHFLKDFKEFSCETPKRLKHFDDVRILQYKLF